MSFVSGVVASVCAAIICGLCALLWRHWRDRKGPLAGWWWEVVYRPRYRLIFGGTSPLDADTTPGSLSTVSDPADDPRALFDDEGDTIWSIELLQVQHHKDRLKAKCWRVWGEDYQRAWRFEAWQRDRAIEGVYWCTSGEGDSGIFQLQRVTRGKWVGFFSESRSIVASEESLKSEFQGTRLSWIRLGSISESEVRSSFNSHPYPPEAEVNWPRKVRRKTHSVLIDAGSGLVRSNQNLNKS